MFYIEVKMPDDKKLDELIERYNAAKSELETYFSGGWVIPATVTKQSEAPPAATDGTNG